MNRTTHSHLSDAQLRRLIDRYFEADTSLSEEELLRREVALRSEPQFDAIRAVLGYAAVKRHAAAKRRNKLRLSVAAAAAVVAVIASVGLGIALGQSPGSSCYAMVGGSRIDDESQVIALMQGSLSDIGDAATEVNAGIESQLSDFAPFISE